MVIIYMDWLFHFIILWFNWDCHFLDEHIYIYIWKCIYIRTCMNPSAAYMRQWIGSTLVQIMACRLFGANWQLDYKEQTSEKFSSKYIFIHENASDIIVWEMVANLSRGRWVKNKLIWYTAHPQDIHVHALLFCSGTTKPCKHSTGRRLVYTITHMHTQIPMHPLVYNCLFIALDLLVWKRQNLDYLLTHVLWLGLISGFIMAMVAPISWLTYSALQIPWRGIVDDV